MSQQFVYDIKLSTGISPKSLDPEGFPLVETKYIETAEGHRLSDKLNAVDNQLLLNDQKIDAESVKLQNTIDSNKSDLDSKISEINEHLAQTDNNVSEEITNRQNFGHAVNNELLKVNNRIDEINSIVGDVETTLEVVKVECKNYTDNEVAKEELARQQAITDEASNRAVADSSLQAQIDNKVNFVNYKADKDVTDDAIRSINNTLNSIPNTYATKAEVSGVENTIQGKIDLKLNKAQFDVFESVVDGKFTDIDTEVGSLQQEVTGIKQDYLKSVDRTELENSINSKLSESTFNSYKEQTNSNVQSLSNSITTLNNTVVSNKEECDEKISKKANSSDVYTKTEIDVTINSLQQMVNDISNELDGTVKSAIQEEADRATKAEADLNDKIDTKVDSITYQNKIGELTTAISLKADITTVEVIDLQGKKNSDDIVTINESLATKVDVTAYNSDKSTFALKSEIPSIEGLATIDSVTQIATDVEQLQIGLTELERDKVGQEQLNETITVLNRDISRATESAIEQLQPSIKANTDALKLKADKTELDSYVLKEQLASKQDVVVFTSDVITTTTVGSLQAQTNLKGMTLADIIKSILGVEVKVSEIRLSKTSVNLQTNSSINISAEVLPNDATDKTITWSVDNSDIILSNTTGSTITVTAGSSSITAIITATCSGVTAQCVVNVVGELSAAETIVQNELSMYVTDESGQLVEVPFKVVEVSEEDKDADISESGFYQITDSSGNVVEEGYQSALPRYQDGPLTIALPNILSLSDITLYQYDAIKGTWTQKSTGFLTPSSTQNVDGYTIYEDVNNASAGEHFRFKIN